MSAYHNMTLRSAYIDLMLAATALRKELNAAAEEGRDDHAQESDLWPSAEEMLEAIGTWAYDSGNDCAPGTVPDLRLEAERDGA